MKNKNDILIFKAAIIILCVALLIVTVIIAIGQEGIGDNNNMSVSERENKGDIESGNNSKDDYILDELPSDTIRVVIKTEEFKEIEHDSVSMCAASGLVITTDDDADIIKVPENKVFEISSDERLAGSDKVIHVNTADENDGIYIKSVKRGCGNPAYYGKFDIYCKNGKYVIVNEVLLENYIYGIVPSEMSDNYGMEALKAQAVCARSYAAGRMFSPAYPEYNAAVDDSVRYQVYNNYEVTEKIKEAVDATKGEVAKWDGKIIDAYFFASSCGSTAGGEVWSEESGKLGYLKSKILTSENKPANLNDEENFKQFIDNYDENNFDSESSWYRWEICLDMSKLSDGWIEEYGDFHSIEIAGRSSGGVITHLNIVGSKKVYELTSEYDIRQFLGELYESGNNKKGKMSDNTTMLPSACFYVNSIENSKIYLKGGGYGHGVGMSQTAAKKMSDEGYNYKDILNMFYSDVEITK